MPLILTLFSETAVVVVLRFDAISCCICFTNAISCWLSYWDSTPYPHDWAYWDCTQCPVILPFLHCTIPHHVDYHSIDARSIPVRSHGGQWTTKLLCPQFVLGPNKFVSNKTKTKILPTNLKIFTLVRDFEYCVGKFYKIIGWSSKRKVAITGHAVIALGYQNGWNKKYFRPKHFLRLAKDLLWRV